MVMTPLVARVAVGTLLALSAGIGTAGAADASSNPRCVSAIEYSKVHKGTLLSRAHRTFGTSGTVLFHNGASVGNGAREYPVCAAWASATGKRRVQVQYNNYATGGGPMRVVLIQYY